MNEYIESRIDEVIKYISGEDDLSLLTNEYCERSKELIMEVVQEVIEELVTKG